MYRYTCINSITRNEFYTPPTSLFIGYLKTGILIFLGLSLFALQLPAAAAQLTPEESTEPDVQEIAVSELVKILEKETDIATRSKLNVDFVPGMVTVLNGDELQARGIRNVWEALGLVPGFQLSIEPTGSKEVNVRSMERTFVSGTVKLLVNGISINSSFTGSAARVLEIPIAQVERIEVIRGPGSAIHGEFAYTAVVGVTTKTQNNAVFGAVEKYDTYRLGGMYSWSDQDRDISGSINIAATDSDGADVYSGLDKLYGVGMGSISYSPGPTNEDLEAQSMFLDLAYKDFKVIAQYLNHGFGDHFGTDNVLPPDENRIVYQHRSTVLELQQSLHINSQLDGKLKLGWLDYLFTGDRLLINPPGFAGSYPDGMIGSPHYEERRLNLDLGFTWTGLKDNKILTEWIMTKTTMGDVWQETNYVPSTLAPLSSTQRFTGAENFIEEGQSRTLRSLVIQDEFTFDHTTTFTLAMRYDHYDDVGDKVTPRLGGVWRLDRNNILKAQYSSAFRPPNFLEMYIKNNPVLAGNREIEPQTSDNYEVEYIYRNQRQVNRVTLFKSVLNDVIVLDNGMYANSGGARLAGIELETEQEINGGLKLNANFSFTDTKDSDTGEHIPNVSDWLLNIGLLYEPIKDLALSAQYQCVCDYGRASNDNRETLDGHQTFDVTVNSFNTWYEGLVVRAGIKNLFDDEIKYPSLPGTYPGDYPRPGRSWWMEISKEF